MSERTRAGDIRAAAVWADQILQMTERCAQRRGLDADQAADCAMEFLARVLDRSRWPEGGPPTSASPPGWLFRCAGNHVTDFLRAHRRRQQREGPSLDGPGDIALSLREPGPSPEARLLTSWSLGQVACAVRRLSPVQREAFLGYYVTGLAAPILADTLHLSAHALQQTLFRARQRLRAMLARQGLSEDELRALLRDPA